MGTAVPSEIPPSWVNNQKYVLNISAFRYGDGDNPATLQIDEGATYLDFLHIRIWDSSDNIEYAGSDIRFFPGHSGSQSYFMPSEIPPVWELDKGFVLSIDTSTHFNSPNISYQVCNYIGQVNINNTPAAIGDEIAIFDPQGILCGHSQVSTPGKYGVIHVYADNPQTDHIDEGASPGDTLSFKIWDQSTRISFLRDARQTFILILILAWASSSFSACKADIFKQFIRKARCHIYQSVSRNTFSRI